MILWCYVGISNSTALSVHKQFLLTVQSLNQVPEQMRSDKGMETLQMACSQVHLTPLSASNANLRFHDAYLYGTSTHNIRIESWWRQLTDRETGEWVLFFGQRKNDGLYDGRLPDKIALLRLR